ncbi:hypothetical protein CCAN11_2470004 [Capnocytophaga canimorsus]|uniref:LysM domain-containing protein n=1 Tax=Capnocytophaga canimorsus TaxID=28188 RepID=A0A0B7IR42_9FLAO|nr:hypothetical protein CCAN11_2470004 [Capnocytophaga canimorsus]
MKSGDTLYKISREQNVSIERIVQLNNLTNNNIQAGQQLLLE